MRPRPSLLLAVLAFLTAAALSSAEITKTLTIEHAPAGSGKIRIENLAGSMRVVPGEGDRIVAVATLHAESEELAAKVDFVEVPSEKGSTVLRVRYPVEEHSVFRYPGRGEEGVSILGISLGSESSAEYAGRRVKVGGSRGVLLYADVEVRLPRKSLDVTFRNVFGPLRAEGVEGTLAFDTAAGDVTLDRLEGRIVADTGSGDVRATSVEGSFDADTGSGDVALDRFRGEEIRCDTGSGDVKVSDASARRIEVDTGSGNVSVLASDIEGWSAETGSGDVRLEAAGSRARAIEADTGSGDVTVRLDPAAAFEAVAEQGHGDIRSGFADAQPILEGREVVGYRRGDGRIRVRVETGSGDFRIEPLR